jgi:hypothetical protein
MRGHAAHIEEMKEEIHAYKILAREPERKKPHGRHRHT